jgi:hypothetical protein
MARVRPHTAPALAAVVLLLIGGTAPGATATTSPGAGLSHTTPLAASSECSPFPGADAFVERIDNRYMPLIPGALYIYEGSEDGEFQRNTVEVTHDTKSILGVDAVVVLDIVKDKHGDLIEKTFDWFGQDENGNVWYLGEDSKEYENGQVVSTEGSWEAGIDGAKPGIIMEAQPKVGDVYQQECFPGVAEDQAKVLGRNAPVSTPFGDFGHTLRTRETTPSEPGVAEDKFYAQCIGMVRTTTVQGGQGESRLVEIKHGPSPTELGCKKPSNRGGNGKGGHHHKQHQHRHHHRRGR